MDLSTLLMRVDQRHYGTLAAFVADLQAIPAAATQYWDNDPRGAREVPPTSRFCIKNLPPDPLAHIQHHFCRPVCSFLHQIYSSFSWVVDVR